MKKLMCNPKRKMIALIVIISVFYYFIYHNCIMTSDDYRYIFSRLDGTLVNSFSSAWNSFVAEYLNWSGRLAHLWDMLLLLSKGEIWKVLTPVLLACTPFLLFYFYYLRIPESLDDYLKIAVCFALTTTYSDLYTVQMLYWHTACITYFYMPFAMIIFLIPFRKLLKGLEVHVNTFTMVLMMTAAFALGMSQEVVGAIVTAFVGFTILFRIISKKRISLFEILIFFSAFVGFSILILAPGNGIRQAMPTFMWWNEANLIGKIRHGLGQYIYNVFHVPYLITIFLFFVLSIQPSISKKRMGLLNVLLTVIYCIFLLGFAFADQWMKWEILEVWKYTQGYFYLSNSKVLIPVLVYGFMSLHLVLMASWISWEKKDVIPFLLICAILCSNLTVLFSSVGTSYISFPGIMLTLGLIMYLLPTFNLKSVKIGLICLCMFFFIRYVSLESGRMVIVQQEEQDRISLIKNAVENNSRRIVLKRYSQRVWEGDYISEEYRKYYNIPFDYEIVFEE